ncbi:hypothetical protein SUDANB176_07877 (plasmid) [Streptomyces sp. enrichment culture]
MVVSAGRDMLTQEQLEALWKLGVEWVWTAEVLSWHL